MKKQTKLLISLYVFFCFSFMGMIISFGCNADFNILEIFIALTLLSIVSIFAIICKSVIEWLFKIEEDNE